MSIVQGDPLYIEDQDKYFMSIATAIASGSSHPIVPGGCILVRDRDIIGSGRSLLASCRVEIDCVAYCIASAAKNGTSTTGAVLYTTRYPFSAAIFQLQVLGLRRIVVLAHDWEAYYKDEFRRAARLAREMSISIEPLFIDEDERFQPNTQAPRFDEKEKQFHNKDLYTGLPAEAEQFPIERYIEHDDEPKQPSSDL
jgi:deoxycytidylate deaminase